MSCRRIWAATSTSCAPSRRPPGSGRAPSCRHALARGCRARLRQGERGGSRAMRTIWRETSTVRWLGGLIGCAEPLLGTRREPSAGIPPGCELAPTRVESVRGLSTYPVRRDRSGEITKRMLAHKRALNPSESRPKYAFPARSFGLGRQPSRCPRFLTAEFERGLAPGCRVDLWTGRVRQEGMRGRRPWVARRRHPGKGGGVGVRAGRACARSLGDGGAGGARGSHLVAFERPAGPALGAWGRPCAVMPLEPDARSVRDGGSS
jgi:hypothetical protein